MHRTVVNSVVGLPGQKFAAWLLTKNAPTLSNFSTRHYNVPAASEPFLNGSSSQYVEDMYNAWLADPSSVHTSWDSFFRNSSQGGAGYQAPPSLAPLGRNEISVSSLLPSLAGSSALGAGAVNEKVIDDHLAVQAIIRSYQIRGHHIAQLDPLGINSADLDDQTPSELVYKSYNFGNPSRTYSEELKRQVQQFMQKLTVFGSPVHQFTTGSLKSRFIVDDKPDEDLATEEER